MKNMKSEQKEVIADVVEVENFVTEPNPTPTVTRVKKKVGIQYRNTPNEQVFVSGDANAEFEVIDDSNGEVVGKGKTTDKGESIVICSYISKTLKAIALSLICVINIFAQQTTQVNVQQQTLTATGPLVKTGNVLSINPASTTSAGSMSIADKIKLDGLNITQLPDFWRLNRGANGAVPDGVNDVIENIGHQSDIYVGDDALVTVGHGGGNVASNTVIGNFALENNTTGNSNTANGNSALYSNTTGGFNTANGVSALFSNTTGDFNTAIGNYSLYYIAKNNRNTSIGQNSSNDCFILSTGAVLTASTTTQVNISPALTGSWAVGEDIVIVLQTPFSSSISGFYEGVYKIVNATTLEVLRPNTVLGTTGTVNSVEVRQGRKIDNSTALGYNAEPTASNQVMLGDANVTQVVSTGTFFGAGFTVASDKRIKSEIKDLTPEMITALKSIKPKIYKNANTGKTEMGVIAQDIPAILRPYLVTIIPQVYSKEKSAELKLLMVKKLGFKSVSDYTKAVEANRLTLLSKPRDAKLLAEKERLTVINDTAYLTDFYSVDYAKLAAMVALVK